MSTLAEISLVFSRMSDKAKKNIRSALYEESKHILSDLESRSPVDTGFFKSNWKVRLSRFSSSGNIVSVSITNKTPYAYFMEYGAAPHKAPWYYPNRDTKGRFKKGTGKLKISKGRVWAGGLSPGHSQTVGGAIGPTLFESKKRTDQLTKKIADAAVRGFK